MCTTVVSERPRDRPLWRGRQEHSAGQGESLRPAEASPSSLGSREEPRELSQVEARVPPSPFLALHGRPRERNVTRGHRHWLRRSDVRRVVAAGPAAGRVRSAGEPALEPRRAFAPRAPLSDAVLSLWFSRKRAGSARAQDSTTMKPTESQIPSSSPRTLGEGRPLVGLRRDRPPRWPEARGLHLAGTCLCEPGLCLRRGAA